MNPVTSATPRRSHLALPRYYYGGKPVASSRITMAGDFRTPGQFRPIVTIRWGRRGKGKTLSMTAAGYHFKLGYKARGLDRMTKEGTRLFRIFANYQVSYADVSHPQIVERLIEFPKDARNLHVMLDEIAVYFHRRRWMRSENLDMEAFITQIRKRNVEVDMATQFPQRVDSDIQDQIDLFIDCDLEDDGCGHPDHRYCVMQRIHDWWGQWTGKTWRKPWPPNVWEYDRMMWFHNCDQFFQAYRDEAVHAALWLDDEVRDDMIRQEWGDDVPDLDGPSVDDMKALADKHGPRRKEAEAEIAGWQQYDPDMAVGKPGEDQLGDFIYRLLRKSKQEVENINSLMTEAKRIDPNIQTRKDLIWFCKGHGWVVDIDGHQATVRLK
ncbi:hypothetical protein LCGC14_1770870 [marine sediment metagenome]|uniref:Uncharacterized protein n=1 Tax=marine sediment metagenome TaxID=412755 RepID=A0A0F9HKW1_9ZZZZ